MRETKEITNYLIKFVMIIGGIHGNELIGVYLIKLFEKVPHLIQRPSFESSTLLANPKAVAECRRHIEKDLNRSFNREDLNDPTLSTFEDKLAKQIYKNLKSQNQSQISMFVDLHSTTANMGLTLILVKLHPWLLQLAVYLSSINPEVRVIYIPSNAANNVLISQCELGFAIEVGPVPQGVLDAVLFQKTKEIVYAILDYLQAFNQGLTQSNTNTLTLYEYVGTVDYPRNEHGEIQAMIHPQLQSRDFAPLNPGEPIFLAFDEEIITYKGASTIYPIFINEAAYYEQGTAMCLTNKRQIVVEAL
ncbi:aspartoacylase (plasmid) [Nostoc sp. UHCC 0302]|uniref:aspartoacylase n=1 Tax=Nostoc sp. UHCC 0302 TaxID=3134896 RepID=UPI00311CA4F6